MVELLHWYEDVSPSVVFRPVHNCNAIGRWHLDNEGRIFVRDNGEHKHRFTQEEVKDIFMLGVPYEEFAAAHGRR